MHTEDEIRGKRPGEFMMGRVHMKLGGDEDEEPTFYSDLGLRTPQSLEGSLDVLFSELRD